MPVVQMKSGAPLKLPAVDPELVSHLEMLLEHARKGEIQGYCAGYIVNGDDDNWYMADEGQIPLLSFTTRKAVHAIEADD
jgi:hypothetical protein